MVTKKNIGVFEIRQDDIKNKTEQVAAVFSYLKIIPVRCEVLFYCDKIRYTAISENFKEVPENMTISEYFIEITVDESGEFKKAEFVPFELNPTGIPFDPKNNDQKDGE